MLNKIKMMNHHRLQQSIFLILMLAVCLLSLQADSTDLKSVSFWITSDLQGYLTGCECPSGFSAGISAVLPALDERNRDTEPLIDAGGFREPLRSDPLLEKYLDQAAGILGYSSMLLSPADMRDNNREYRERRKITPVTDGAGLSDSRIFGKLPGEGAIEIIDIAGTSLALGAWYDDAAQSALDDQSGGRIVSRNLNYVLDTLEAAEADYRVLVVRGRSLPSGLKIVVDLVIYAGPDSPAAELHTGGEMGIIQPGGETLRWLSLAPRGNSLARVTLRNDSLPEISIKSLERGISPESPEILALGEAFMDELVENALAASGRKKVEVIDTDALEADYWYPFGCRECDDFLWNTVPDIETDTGRSIQIKEWNTSDSTDFESLLQALEEESVELRSVPVMIAEGKVFQGDESIKAGLESLASGDSVTDSVSRNISWEPGAIFLAGLLDGINPCAFSAMVFLVSALALAGRAKKTMLAIGLFYAAGVFLTYSAIGAGLLGGLRRIAVESGIRQILEYILGGFLLILAVLSLLDGIKLSRGQHNLLLKLPEKLSKRIHSIIRENVRSGTAAGGAFLLGAVVALIELGCTGQVYLPTIAWMISRGESSTPWLWLLIYNLAFIIPLLLVFVVSYKGVTAVRLAGVFKRRGAFIKYATAGLFIVLALVILGN